MAEDFMNGNEQDEDMDRGKAQEDVRDWERSDWFRKWMELIRPQTQKGSTG